MTTGIPMLETLVERDGDQLVVRAPAVGTWIDPPPNGRPLGAGSAVGTLARLGRRYSLVLPSGAVGTVLAGRSPRDHVVDVEYGQILFRLAPAAGTDVDASQSTDATAPDDRDLASGMHAVVSPTDGIFYRRPSPEALPFVESGANVDNGQAVGLVEVMKTFNHILYGGVGLPDRAQVVEIRCGDVEEVRAGQVLMIVRAIP